MLLNLGKQSGVQDSADLNEVDAATRLKIMWRSAGWRLYLDATTGAERRGGGQHHGAKQNGIEGEGEWEIEGEAAEGQGEYEELFVLLGPQQGNELVIGDEDGENEVLSTACLQGGADLVPVARRKAGSARPRKPPTNTG